MLEKIIDLAVKSGDRCIIWDKNAQKAFVIMPFDKYEEFLVDKANFEAMTNDNQQFGFIDEIPEDNHEDGEIYFEPIE